MKASLRALLSGVIDYAGLFPPAQLPLDQALKNYAEYRAGPDAWMLGRFVCPAAKLAELTQIPPLSVVGRGGATNRDVAESQTKDNLDVVALHQRQPDAVIEGYELRLPLEWLDISLNQRLRVAIADLAGKEAGANIRPDIFLEVEYGSDWSKSVMQLASYTRREAERTGLKTGLKIRCGGATAAAVPTVKDLGAALTFGVTFGLPLKFTAGLHHPLRRRDSSLGVKTHGFLNVFVAGVLGHARRLDPKPLGDILEDEDPKHFRFDDDGLSWNDICATTDEVTAARRDFVTSFGSCSFDEPREDLRALGLMD